MNAAMKLIPIHIKERHDLHFEQCIHQAEYKAKATEVKLAKGKEEGKKGSLI